ncbi:alpha/beta hydrolase [Pseudomonadota bacterium]
MNLTYVETQNTQNHPKKLVVLLHGYGSNAEDLISLAPEFAEVLPDAHFISPNAPFEFEGGLPNTYQWFSLHNVTIEEIEKQVILANEILGNFLDEQLARFGLKDENLILIGFSQGAMISMYHSLRREEEILGVLGYSGKLLGIDDMDSKVHSKPRMCLIHGTEDSLVPFESLGEAELVLGKYGVKIEAHSIVGLDHGINSEGIEIGKEFLGNL